MLFSTLVILASSLSSVFAVGPAPLSKENPKNIVAVADFPEAGPNKFTKGYVYFTSPKGDSVKVHVDMTGLPTSGGPFVYHIHEKQIFSKTDCEEAGKHFDPFNGFVKCPEKGDDSFCMVGDLSGKHGWINATCFQTEYYDKFLSLNPISESYIVGRSLVFHDQQLTRFACANINLASAEQYEYLFGNPNKSSGSNNAAQDTVPKHPSMGNHIPEPPSPKVGEEPKQQPPAPVAPEPKSPVSPSPEATHVPNKTLAPSEKLKPSEKNSTAGSVANPKTTGEAEGEGANHGFAHKATETESSAVLVSSGPAYSSFFRGLLGTIFSVILGVVF